MVSTRGRKDVLPSSSLSTLGDVLSQSLKRAREEEEEEAAREEEAKEEEVEDAIEDTSVDAQMVEDELGAGEPTGSSCTMRSEVGAAGLEEEEAQLRRQDTYRKLMVLAAGRSIVKSEYAQGNPTPSGSGVNSTSSGELQAGPTQGVKLEEPVASGTDGKRTPAMIAERRRVAEEIREEKLARVRRSSLSLPLMSGCTDMGMRRNVKKKDERCERPQIYDIVHSPTRSWGPSGSRSIRKE